MAIMIGMLSLMSMSVDEDDDHDHDNSSKVVTMPDILYNSRIINQAILYFPKSVFNQFSKIK